MAGHPKLPEYEPVPSGFAPALHRAETIALWAEEAYLAGNSMRDGDALAAIAQAWATIAVAHETGTE
jgi:hypothetical protein